jgi:hypothetical protein
MVLPPGPIRRPILSGLIRVRRSRGAQFDYPTGVWMKHQYSVVLTITDTKTPEIFYFCHIHNYMSGNQFACFASTQVQILTPEEQARS